jgi:hypothetical protein
MEKHLERNLYRPIVAVGLSSTKINMPRAQSLSFVWVDVGAVSVMLFLVPDFSTQHSLPEKNTHTENTRNTHQHDHTQTKHTNECE